MKLTKEQEAEITLNKNIILTCKDIISQYEKVIDTCNKHIIEIEIKAKE